MHHIYPLLEPGGGRSALEPTVGFARLATRLLPRGFLSQVAGGLGRFPAVGELVVRGCFHLLPSPTLAPQEGGHTVPTRWPWSGEWTSCERSLRPSAPGAPWGDPCGGGMAPPGSPTLAQDRFLEVEPWRRASRWRGACGLVATSAGNPHGPRHVIRGGRDARPQSPLWGRPGRAAPPPLSPGLLLRVLIGFFTVLSLLSCKSSLYSGHQF